MRAVLYRYRASLRLNWREWTTLAVLTGVASSFALAAAADARRTDTALPRALAAGRSADVSVSADQGAMGRSAALAYLSEVERLPGVEQSTRTSGVYLDEVAADGSEGKRLSFGSAVGKLIDRPSPGGLDILRLLKGRLPGADRPDEVIVNPELQRVTGWKVGERVRSLRLVRLEGFDKDGNADPKKGTPLDLTIVGVGRMPYELFDSAADRKPQVYLFPPFASAHPESSYYVSSALKVAGGEAEMAKLRSRVEKVAARYGRVQVLFSVRREGLVVVQNSLRPQVLTIWVLAAVLLLAGLLLGAQAIGRQIVSHNSDTPSLLALGMTRRNVGTLVMLHGMTIASGAAMVAVPLAWLSSAFTPLGSTGVVEPSPGVHLDAAILLIGAGIAVLALSVASWVSAMGLARTLNPSAGRTSGSGARAKPSRLVGLVARTGLPPTAVTGSRFALQTGVGRSATPARSVLSSIALALGVIGVAVSFTSSLDHLLGTPREYGWDWDVAGGNPFGPIPDDVVDAVRARPEVSAVAAFAYGNVRIDGRSISAAGIDQIAGTVFPTMNEGRVPQSESDIVLGPLTMKTLGRKLGDRVAVDTGRGIRNMTIVGTATFPSIGNTRTSNTGLGRGAATVASLFPASENPHEGRYNGVFIRIDPKLDREKALSSLRAFFVEQGCTDSGCFFTDGKPTALSGYESLGTLWLPFALALGVVFTISLAHGITTMTRSRRRDLGIMAALGMTRRQAGRVVLWQAGTIIMVALMIGIPFAIVTANGLWGVFSDRLGMQGRPSIPFMHLALLSSAALAGALMVGLTYVPATRRAAAAGLSDAAE